MSVLASPLAKLRAILLLRADALNQGAEDLQVWRQHLLNGLCAIAFGLGLLVAIPSMWASAQQGLWALMVADLFALLGASLLHFHRTLPYRRRALALLAVTYLVSVALLFSLGPLSQIYLTAVPVLCAVLIGSGPAALAVAWCSATLFLAGYVGGIPQGMVLGAVSPLVYWTVLSVNFLLVAALLVLSSAYLLHGLDGALTRERANHERERRQELALRESLAAQRAAESANQLKSEFLAMISHEIRTPLGGVISMLRLAQKDGSLAANTRSKLRIGSSNAEVLLQIINDILDLSRLEAGKMPLEVTDFDLPALLNDVVDLLRDRAETKGISLVAQLDPALNRWWRGDPVRLRQVVLNLLGNGIKFTARGEVRLALSTPRDGGVVLTISDTGIGIPEDAISRLFQKFEQADAAISRTYGGAGLGLAICKNIVCAMEGRIEVESALGAGTVFKVTLPLQAGQPVPCRLSALARPHACRLAILCAEDGATNQIILRELLETMGHTIVMAEDGKAALEALAESDFDLVIMDSRMPRMDGLTALRELRAGTGGVRDASLPVVALTANATEDERDRFLAAGANGFLSKPIDELALHVEIARQIDRLQIQGKPVFGEQAAHRAGAPALAELDAMFEVSALPLKEFEAAGAPGPALRAAFRVEGPRLLEAMWQGVAAADAPAVAISAHSLMGSASYFGAESISARCAHIEKLADAGQLEALKPQLLALETELTLVVASMAD